MNPRPLPSGVTSVVARAGDALEGQLRCAMTAHEVAGSDLFLYRRLLAADLLRILAAGMEMTARRRIGRVGHFALEDDPFGAQARIGLGNCGKQRLGVRMPRR